MIVALKTDSPEATVVLIKDDSIVDTYTWEAHRTLARDLLKVIKERLAAYGCDWKAIEGLILFKGPGSFTGLRIGAAVVNTIAHTKSIPIIGSAGEDWLQQGIQKLQNGENDKIVLPEYGAEARITQQKK